MAMSETLAAVKPESVATALEAALGPSAEGAQQAAGAKLIETWAVGADDLEEVARKLSDLPADDLAPVLGQVHPVALAHVLAGLAPAAAARCLARAPKPAAAAIQAWLQEDNSVRDAWVLELVRNLPSDVQAGVVGGLSDRQSRAIGPWERGMPDPMAPRPLRGL